MYDLARLVHAKDAILFVVCLAVARPDARAGAALLDLPNVPPTDAALLVDDPRTMVRLEGEGYAFDRVLSEGQRRSLLEIVQADMSEIVRGLTSRSAQRPFRVVWMVRGRFELVGVVNRLDRRVFDAPDAPTCGEVRLVYRLALENKGRPSTRMPMTVNVRIPQPAARGADCGAVARAWRSPHDVGALLAALPPPTKVEVNFQSVHIPSSREDMDDHAEYIERTLSITGDRLEPDVLMDTPRDDLSEGERADLLAWIGSNLDAIDDGRALIPARFLAQRAISVSPRGLVKPANRPFARLFGGDDATGSEALRRAVPSAALASRARVTNHALLLRRLDEATCPGCHQSRGIAGFHLLGEERDRSVAFNALAVGHSPHLGADLTWRRAYLDALADGRPLPSSRPFAVRPDGEGAYGAECGVAPEYAAWTCGPGLVCRDLHHGPVGVCAPAVTSRAGEPCEAVKTAPASRPEGPLVTSLGADPSCPAPVNEARTGLFCAPNWLGFTGGMCSERCDAIGEIDARSSAICAGLPSAGYEAECFVGREPVEACLPRHLVRARIATCDAAHPCRDDYACARIPGAPTGVGACIPPYFVFQLRVDGPALDR